MTRLSVSAPGKAFLIGEYAVLEGAAAWVTAIDVRAVAHAAAPGSALPPSAVVACAHARVARYLEARGVEPDERHPQVETGGFTLGARKLGLGSSAAVVAAVVGYHLACAGLDPEDPEVQHDALNLALGAHAEAQGGGGSGADVAAAVLGGVIRFVDGNPGVAELPGALHFGFVDAGAPAVTASFVRSVRAGAQADPGAYRDAMDLLHAAVREFEVAAAIRDRDARKTMLATLRRATALHNDGLRRLATISGAPIMPRSIEAIIRAAETAGLAAKPSGAGGGDLVVVFATERAELDCFGERLGRETGHIMLGDLRCSAAGLRSDDRVPTNSRLGGFFKLSIEDRRQAISDSTGIPIARMSQLDAGALDIHRANHMIENVVGTLELPLAIATNFQVNGRDFLVPMCVEEASVVAAASNAAKMIREGGGFSAHSDPPWMIAQVQLLAPEGARAADEIARTILEHADALVAAADEAHPRLVARGGGARAIEARVVAHDMVIVHVIVDCQDAMGANLLNTVAETVAPLLASLTGWRTGLRILSNLSDRRCAHVEARVPPGVLAGQGFAGPAVVDRVVSASRFAECDPYRAATHNKGIMNGVDAVVLATGNDWRAMEASAHAFAAKDGRYGPLAIWRKGDDGWLHGKMSLPAAVGVVGGATRVHPVATLALEILGCATGSELGQVMAAAGLASNLAALRALATEGIQRGHMSLHARSIALSAGAAGPEVEQLAALLVDDGEIKTERATALLEDMRRKNG